MKSTKQNLGSKEYIDTAIDCASAGLDIYGTLGLAAIPPISAYFAYNATINSAICITKITSLISGMSAQEFNTMSNTLSVIQPLGALSAVITNGKTLKDNSMVEAASILESEVGNLKDLLMKDLILGKPSTKTVFTLVLDSAKYLKNEKFNSSNEAGKFKNAKSKHELVERKQGSPERKQNSNERTYERLKNHTPGGKGK